MQNPFVSFVIATYNRKPILSETLKNIYKSQTLSLEIIVIDNNSGDGTDVEMKHHFTDVVYRKLDSNYAIGAYNRGFKMARGKFIVMLDDDSYPDFDVSQALAEFERDSRLGLIAGNIINLSSGESEFKQDFLAEGEKDTHYFIGCGAIAKKEVLDLTGYFDEKFFLYYNENDLAARIIKKGFKVRFYEKYKFMHKGGEVYRRKGNRFYFEFRNLLWYLIKNFPLLYFLRRASREIRRNFTYALKNGDLRFYFKAIIDTGRNLPYLLKKRRPFTREELLFVLGKRNAL